MALTILVSLLYLMALFDDTPIVILAAIIITAIIGLIDYGAASHLFKTDKLDFLDCLCSFFGVLFISVPTCLIISVAVSLFKILLHITRPNIVVLGKIKGTQLYQDIFCYQQALRVPSFLILGVGSPIYFANSNFLQDRILLLIQKVDELLQANNETKIKCLILDMSAVTAIDTSGLETISQFPAQKNA